jgi:hydrogenase-4 component F
VKAAFFLSAGNILNLYHDKHHANVSGLFERSKGTAWLWLIALTMILGFPPSPLFVSKFFIVNGLIGKGYILPVIALLLMLSAIAWSMIRISLKMCSGESKGPGKLPLWSYLSPAVLLFIAAMLGVWMPVFK